MKIKVLFFLFTMFLALGASAQPPDPCDDCFLAFFTGTITEAELDECLINSACQDVPISLNQFGYIFLMLTGTGYYFWRSKKIRFTPLNS